RARCVPRQPVDDPDSGERDASVTHDNERLGRRPDAECGQHCAGASAKAEPDATAITAPMENARLGLMTSFPVRVFNASRRESRPVDAPNLSLSSAVACNPEQTRPHWRCAHRNATPARVKLLAKRARKPERPGLSLKGSGLVFVATKGGDIRGPSRRGAGLYAWDTRHLSRYEFRPRGGPLRLSSAEVLPDGARLEYSLGRSTR